MKKISRRDFLAGLSVAGFGARWPRRPQPRGP
ncbi:MAG: twin-arginine translocation signal domain-containing protein [Acidobacteria bacterium]|nr:twin-arginine translocation signal domain-containing protein [Acidobacteriota bacterium]